MATNPTTQIESIPLETLKEYRSHEGGPIDAILKCKHEVYISDLIQAYEALKLKLDSYYDGGTYAYFDQKQRQDIRDAMKRLYLEIKDAGAENEIERRYFQ